MTRPMPGPPESESCTCYEEVVGPNDPCGTPEGTMQTVVPTSCDFHSWRVRDASRKKRLTHVECSAEFWRAATVSERARAAQAITRDPGDYLSVAKGFLAASREQITWHRFATRPHALEEA